VLDLYREQNKEYLYLGLYRYFVRQNAKLLELWQTKKGKGWISTVYLRTKMGDTHYEPYGSVLVSEGEGESVFQYTGEMQNNSTGFIYLRSRYYSGNGRFLSKDIFGGNVKYPTSLHKYLYANGNPILFSDPSGLYSQKMIKRMFGVSTYEQVLDQFRYGQLKGKWGFLNILHRASNGDELNIYKLSFTCKEKKFPIFVHETEFLSQQFLSIDDFWHPIVESYSGNLQYLNGYGLLLVDNERVGRNVNSFIQDADFLILQQQDQIYPNNVWATTKHSSWRLIHDKVDTNSLAWDTAELVSMGLFVAGTYTANPYLLIPGVIGESITTAHDFYELAKSTVPLVDAYQRGDDPSSLELEQFQKEVRYLLEDNLWQTVGHLVDNKQPWPIIRRIAFNLYGALEYVP